MAQIIAYYRVSTRKQGASGLGLEAQRADVQKYAERDGSSIVREFTDVESGSHDNRPELKKAVAYAAKTGGVLVVAKLDRLSRNYAFLMTLNEQVQRGKLNVCALNVPTFNTMTVGILATMAQYEREQAAIRTRAAIEAKKARGEKMGRVISDEERAASHERHRANSRGNEDNKRAWKYVKSLIKDNTGKRKPNFAFYASELNDGGFLTANGGEWQRTQVERLARLMYEPTGDCNTFDEWLDSLYPKRHERVHAGKAKRK